MLKRVREFINVLFSKTERQGLQHRFIIRVLIPPFLILAVVATVIFWQLNNYVRKQAIGDLGRAADATALKLEREFSIRQTVLMRTAQEIRQLSDQNQNDRIVSQLSAFSQFFPETVAVVVVDKNGNILSTALSDQLSSIGSLAELAKNSSKQTIEGQLFKNEKANLAIFTYPIEDGGVLAAYDLDNTGFVYQTWASTPIDHKTALTILVNMDGNAAYPTSEVAKEVDGVSQELRTKKSVVRKLAGIEHIFVGSVSKGSNWLVVVASPTKAVFAPLKDFQIIAALVMGTLLVGYLWMGSFFVQRTLKSIFKLVNGALVFADGKLDHKIQMDKADSEFEMLATTMNNMADRIAAAEKEIDEKNKEFISLATHELRTPLTAIVGNLSMVYEDMGDKLEQSAKDLIGQAYNSTKRLGNLVNDLLDVARLEGGRAEFNFTNVDVKKLIAGILNDLSVTAKEKQIKLEYKDSGAVPVWADESRLGIIINNFVSNAIKYNRLGGTVIISHQLQPSHLVTLVQDTGLGIPEDQKQNMFKKFFRVNHANRKNIIGSGLGMYITKQYIEKMGGRVWFESIDGQGTTFYFIMPLAH